jgi:hypothetical protein
MPEPMHYQTIYVPTEKKQGFFEKPIVYKVEGILLGLAIGVTAEHYMK